MFTLRTILLAALAISSVNADMVIARAALGSSIDALDNSELIPWKATPCAVGAIQYHVRDSSVHPQFNNLCYVTPGREQSYSFDVEKGYYAVKLSFIDPSATAINQRLFNVQINGDYYKKPFDLYSLCGREECTIGYMLVVDKKIKITTVGVSWNALLSGIEISKLSDFKDSIGGVLTIDNLPPASPVFYFNSDGHVYGPFQFVGPGPVPAIGPVTVGPLPEQK